MERYQALVCSLAYSATGSLSQGEDLAQEAFLRAWKELPQLREPSKFRPWLCAIVRFLITKARRRDAREPVHGAEPLDLAAESRSLEPLPQDRAISEEEEAILWRSLERIPESYREPMVLFYRGHHSIKSVAQALELSEDAVKQRLARGRRLLHQEVLSFVESALERTNPGEAFTAGVIAALPVFTTSASAATVGAAVATAKGSGVAKSAGSLVTFGVALAWIASLAGGVVALWGRVENTRSIRERKFLGRTSWGYHAWILIWLVLVGLILMKDGALRLSFIGCALLWLSLVGPMQAFGVWVARRQRQIQIEDGTTSGIPAGGFWGGDPARKGFKATVYGSLAALILGASCWLALVGQRTGDRILTAVVPMLAIAAWLVSARAVARQPEKARAVYLSVWWGLTLFILAVVNLRWNFWHRNAPLDQTRNVQALLGANFLLLVFYGSMGPMWLLKQRLVATRNIKRDALVAVTLFCAVIVIGLILDRI